MRRNKKCLIIHLLFFRTALLYVVIYPGFYSYLEEKRPQHIYKLKLNLVLLKNVRKFDYKTINAPFFALLFSSRPCI